MKYCWSLRLAPACQAHAKQHSTSHVPPPSTTGLHLHDIHLPPGAAQVLEQQPRCGHVLRVCQVLRVPTGTPLQGLHSRQAGDSPEDGATLGRCGTQMAQWMLASPYQEQLHVIQQGVDQCQAGLTTAPSNTRGKSTSGDSMSCI